jgi:hypothetical protein
MSNSQPNQEIRDLAISRGFGRDHAQSVIRPSLLGEDSLWKIHQGTDPNGRQISVFYVLQNLDTRPALYALPPGAPRLVPVTGNTEALKSL